jgi:hypothetical protein
VGAEGAAESVGAAATGALDSPPEVPLNKLNNVEAATVFAAAGGAAIFAEEVLSVTSSSRGISVRSF